jgi:RNA recognition motif-containing protein
MVLNKKTKNKLKLITNRNKTDNKIGLASKNFNSSSSSSTSSSCNNNNNQDEKSNNDQASTSLWIGNVDPGVTEDVLIEMFSNFGQLANVRCLPEKYCAFVNFKTKEDAQKAMNNLQVKNIIIN